MDGWTDGWTDGWMDGWMDNVERDRMSARRWNFIVLVLCTLIFLFLLLRRANITNHNITNSAIMRTLAKIFTSCKIVRVGVGVFQIPKMFFGWFFILRLTSTIERWKDYGLHVFLCTCTSKTVQSTKQSLSLSLPLPLL